MGTNGSCFAIWVMITHLLLSSSALKIIGHHHGPLRDPVALDSYLHNHTISAIPYSKLGVLTKVPLPSNFTGMEVSIVRMKSIGIWSRGAGFEPLFNLPPRILPSPFVKTLEIMYQNLGNWSSCYYNLPGYSLLTPVIGFAFYDAGSNQNNTNQKVNITAFDKPITINFTGILSPKFKMSHEIKCVRFDLNGVVELSEMICPNLCTTRLEGHFSVASLGVQPPASPPPAPVSPPPHRRPRQAEQWHWWVIGFGAGLCGVILVAMIAFGGFILRKLKWMEKSSENGEVLDSRWIRDSRLPSASITRTQPDLEIE